MLWEVEIQPKGSDVELKRVAEEFALLTHLPARQAPVQRTARGYILEGDLDKAAVERLITELLLDPLVERSQVTALDATQVNAGNASSVLTILPKPGVMDPVALSVADAARDLDIQVRFVRTFRRYFLREPLTVAPGSALARVLANDAIEGLVQGPLGLDHLAVGRPYTFQLATVPIRAQTDDQLRKLSDEKQLSLSLEEMRSIQQHFRELGRDPTDVELETIAQTWSEHCSHKTLKGAIDLDGRRITNLLKETIFEATQEIRRRLGPDDWCVSVFEDNAGIVRFDDQYHVCFKVETHNHPSAIEPYGGANTGLGGVIRDVLGTGLGALPVCNTDVFCFAPPDTLPEELPPGVLHPGMVMKGVVAGVRDYGNRMGIPTVNGAVCFDPRYLANPLVFCGTVGLLPVYCTNKAPHPGDLIVVVGGRTGRDGIHGATFSSAQLTAESESVSGGAVQIGNAITEKKMLDVLMQARDLGLYHAITDCGAGGFSSAVGEMGEALGAEVHLDQAPLKYEGLSYTEIWISESQERMVLAVAPHHWPLFESLCRAEDVEATTIGRFATDGRLRLFYQDHQVADLDMRFLHHGRPAIVRKATLPQPPPPLTSPAKSSLSYTDALLRILGSYNVCSKEWIIRQYDHEVQGSSVIKPLVGIKQDGPSDAAVLTPVLGSFVGIAVGCGINPHYGDCDPYRMAAAAVDEAIRNVVAVGADPSRIALLDNFCWGNTDRPEILGSLVRAAEACRDVAIALGTPFISGKDSLNNEYRSGDRHITIPSTLLISALGRIPDIRQCVTMDLKIADSVLYLVGVTHDEMGGSHYQLITGCHSGEAPQLDTRLAPVIFQGIHQAIRRGLLQACHDLSEGGLAVALAESAFAGGLGAEISLVGLAELSLPDEVLLFSESTSRFLVEVKPGEAEAFRHCFAAEVPVYPIGHMIREGHLHVAGADGQSLISVELNDLSEAWQKPLRW